MKNKKYILIGIVSILILSGLFFIYKKEKRISLIVPFDKNYLDQKIGSKKSPPESIKVLLYIQDKKYEVEVNKVSRVFDVMEKLEKIDDSFSFKYKEYSSMGIFINEINGLKTGEGGNWLYYVNGKQAEVGVSNYKINNGDIISWKYEK